MGPAIRNVQRRRANLELHPFIVCDESVIEHNMSAHLVRLSNGLGSVHIYFTLDIYFTRVAQAK